MKKILISIFTLFLLSIGTIYSYSGVCSVLSDYYLPLNNSKFQIINFTVTLSNSASSAKTSLAITKEGNTTSQFKVLKIIFLPVVNATVCTP